MFYPFFGFIVSIQLYLYLSSYKASIHFFYLGLYPMHQGRRKQYLMSQGPGGSFLGIMLFDKS